MDILQVEDTQDTPKVLFNKAAGTFELSGRSLPEDAVDFYTPVIDWLTEYSKDCNPTTVFNFKLEYFNTASSKLIFDLLHTLREIKGIQIVWYYNEDDEDILDAGKEFSEQLSIPFEYKPM